MNLCIAILVSVGWLGWLALAYLLELPSERALLRTVFYALVSVDIVSVAGKLVFEHVTSFGLPQAGLIMFCLIPFPLAWQRLKALEVTRKQGSRAEYRRRSQT